MQKARLDKWQLARVGAQERYTPGLPPTQLTQRMTVRVQLFAQMTKATQCKYASKYAMNAVNARERATNPVDASTQEPKCKSRNSVYSKQFKPMLKYFWFGF